MNPYFYVCIFTIGALTAACALLWLWWTTEQKAHAITMQELERVRYENRRLNHEVAQWADAKLKRDCEYFVSILQPSEPRGYGVDNL